MQATNYPKFGFNKEHHLLLFYSSEAILYVQKKITNDTFAIYANIRHNSECWFSFAFIMSVVCLFIFIMSNVCFKR